MMIKILAKFKPEKTIQQIIGKYYLPLILLLLVLLIIASQQWSAKQNYNQTINNSAATNTDSNFINQETTKQPTSSTTLSLFNNEVNESTTQNFLFNPTSTYFQVTRVVDGDTIDVNLDNKIERIRLIGINTPEVVDPRRPVECFGQEASANAKKILSGQKIRIEADSSQDDRDKYGRLLRYVWRADGLFYNLEAIKQGYAYEYTYNLPYQYQAEFKAAQKFAEENQLGLWAESACADHTKIASSTTNGNCSIKGNISSRGEKIYHLPNCPYYQQTVIDASKGEKWFCSEAEAIQAGWRKANNCP
ncbi:MAG: thermonuclease family protein [Candidatus Falkowbacteria bacterium]|nr:thermonuclease family protein [Candidatus Falkowbacteria bacterium]